MWFLFQIAIINLIIASNGARHWEGHIAVLPSRYSRLSRPEG